MMKICPLKTGRILSRRDWMKVAWHVVPGKLAVTIRPVGNGMSWAIPLAHHQRLTNLTAKRSYRTLRDGITFARFQAFRARLPSFSPSGTIQNSDTPLLR